MGFTDRLHGIWSLRSMQGGGIWSLVWVNRNTGQEIGLIRSQKSPSQLEGNDKRKIAVLQGPGWGVSSSQGRTLFSYPSGTGYEASVTCADRTYPPSCCYCTDQSPLLSL